MASITCPQRDKTFRTESGLNWHLENIHGQKERYPQRLSKEAVLKNATAEDVLEHLSDEEGARLFRLVQQELEKEG